jgi:hypothetical protein
LFLSSIKGWAIREKKKKRGEKEGTREEGKKEIRF